MIQALNSNVFANYYLVYFANYYLVYKVYCVANNDMDLNKNDNL